MEQSHSYDYKKVKYICIGFATALHILALLLFILFFKFPKKLHELRRKTPAPILIKQAPTPPKPVPQPKPIAQKPKPPMPKHQPRIRPLQEEKQQSASTLNAHEEQEGIIQPPKQPQLKQPQPRTPQTTPENKAKKLVKALKRNKNSKAKWFRKSYTPLEETQEIEEQKNTSLPKTFEEQMYERHCAQSPQGTGNNQSRAQQHVQSFAKELYNKKVARALCIASRNTSYKINSTGILNTTATLLLELEPSGTLRNVSLIKTSGNYIVDSSLLKIARNAHYPPIPSEFKDETMHMPMNIHIHMDQGTHNLILDMMY